jgi:acyl-coenzyme A synthetase/AMP-(fatty) acid ligase
MSKIDPETNGVVQTIQVGNGPAGVSFAASLARTASGKLQKQAIRASLRSVAVQ